MSGFRARKHLQNARSNSLTPIRYPIANHLLVQTFPQLSKGFANRSCVYSRAGWTLGFTLINGTYKSGQTIFDDRLVVERL